MCKINNVILHKEIDLIQACITRMAHNSFLIKGWTISIVAVVLALTGKSNEPVLLCTIILIPLISFWYLDTFFLRTEKMYRLMYEWVLNKRKNDDEELLYNLNPTRFKNQCDSRLKVMFSETLRWFYGIPFFIVVGIIIFQITVTMYLYKNPSQLFSVNKLYSISALTSSDVGDATNLSSMGNKTNADHFSKSILAESSKNAKKLK